MAKKFILSRAIKPQVQDSAPQRRNLACGASLGIIIFFLYLGFTYGADKSETPEWMKRVSVGADVGDGRDPRVYFETIQPLYQDIEKENTFFVHPRYSFQGDNAAYNLGFGYRKLLNDNSVLLGGNTYFDFEDDDKHYRVGFGTEAFLNQVEIRANSYIGLSPRRLVSTGLTGKTYEKAVDGFDWEVGMPVPYTNWIKLFAGGNWYNYEKFNNKEGWSLRTEIKPFKFQTINFIFFDDNKGSPTYRFDARVTIPFGAGADEEKLCNIGFSKEAYPEKIDHSNRVLDRVEREYTIQVEKWTETATATIEVRRGNN